MNQEEEIAIVGVGCRFPGANNLREFWRVLENGENHVREIPKDRWNLEAVYDSNPDAYGKTYVRRAGLLTKHDEWDNTFFGIGEKEASEMDPQQKYVLECVHMALENGGITRKELDGSATSVYIGAMNSDYKSSKEGDSSLLTNYTVTGDAASIITARVSYNYNLLGPSLTIDTACSSALVAIHLAVQSMMMGESSMAICGGVNSILYPEMFITLSKARMASPTGQCQAFSANADGYARGEGCGIVILEKLSDALRNGRHIWATIRTGCNQDGQTARPITAPSQLQQYRLLQDIYTKHNIDPTQVQYLEAHGTGTPVGDPVEVNSLGGFFKDYPVDRSAMEGQRFIGSVKTNIGHLESGAGAAGLIKTLLMMKYEKIVPSLHSLPRNPKITFEDYALQVPMSVIDWPSLDNGSRAACINCFGFGGTNSHAFVKQWVKNEKEIESVAENLNNPTFVPVSAKSQNALVNVLQHLGATLSEGQYNLKQLAFTATSRRDHYRYRKMLISSTIDDVVDSCKNAVDQITKSTVIPSKDYRMVYVFCGVGTAWTQMGQDIIKDFPLFADVLKGIDRYLIPFTGWSIKQKLEEGQDMDDPFISHIGIFACQVGLATIWKHWGIQPDAIVGQSVGEVAAAYSCGVLSLEDAVRVIYYRSKLLADATGGKMMVVRNISTSKVDEICSDVGHVNVAVYNSKQSCTISGDNKSIEDMKGALTKNNTDASDMPLLQELAVKCAYHSHKVLRCADYIKEKIGEIKIKTPSVPIYSTVTGRISDLHFGSASYWKENVSKPVLFYQALQEATTNSPTVFLEIGPKPVLKAHLLDIFGDQNVVALPSMKYKCGSSQIRNTLGELYTVGFNPDWKNIVDENDICDLPQYQFDFQRLMMESDYKFLKKQGYVDDSTGRYLMLTQKEKENEFKITLSPSSTPFVYEHVIDNAITIPGATYAEVAFELGMCLLGTTAESLNVEYDIIKAVSVTEGTPCFLDLKSEIEQNENGSQNIMFSVLKDNSSVARGFVRSKSKRNNHSVVMNDLELDDGKHMQSTEIYRELANYGYKYGEPVQVLESVSITDNECTGVLNLTEDIYRYISSTSFHPAVFDAMLHSSALSFLLGQASRSYKIYPIRMGSVEVTRPLEKRMVCYTKTMQNVYDRIITNIILTTPDGLLLAEAKEIELKIIDGTTSVNALVYQTVWNQDETFDSTGIAIDGSNNNHITIFYGNDVLLKTLRNVFPFGKSFKLSSIAQHAPLLDSHVNGTNEETVIYAPGTHISSCSADGGEVFENVCTNCTVFLNIIKSMRDVVKTLIVITENTQVCLTPENEHKNVLSAELWGFVRSVRQERTKCPVVLIDVQPSIEKEIIPLYNTVQAVVSGRISASLEFLLVDGNLYSKSLERRPQSGLQIEHRFLYKDSMQTLELRSSKPDAIEKPFLLPIENVCGDWQKRANFRVDRICLHSLRDFKVTETDSELTKQLWSDYCGFGFPVIALEFYGTEIHHRRNKKAKTMIACYPSMVSNKIFVPKQCFCDLDDLPFYREGLFICSLIMWSLSKYVKQGSKVYIITESMESDLVLPLLLFKLKIFKQCEVEVLHLEDLKNSEITKGCTYIILDEYLSTNINNILKPGNTIIGLENHTPHLSDQIVQLHTRRINVQMIAKKTIFAPHNIVKTFPKVKQWLILHLKNKDLYKHIQKANTLNTLHVSEINCIKASSKQMIRKDSTYIVVGGLSGLGWELVKWLKQRGAGVVITLSRKGPSLDMKQKLKNATDIHTSHIEAMSCDVGNYTDVQRTFATIKSRYPNYPIRGIFQGAGVLRDALVEHMTVDKFKDVLRPKVLGTWNLHLVSKDLPLDFFVMHSSTTSIFGNAGQTNYGAANSFMDSVAHYRRAKKLPGQSLNWGALAVGMANDKAILENLESLGYYSLDTEKIQMCMMDSLLYNPTQIMYGMFDWNMIKDNMPIEKNFEVDKERYMLVNKSKAKRQAVTPVLDMTSFQEMTFEKQRETIANILFDSLSKVLSLDVSELEETENLLGLGMESQKAMEFIQVINKATGCRLPIAYILSPEYTLGMLIDFTQSHIIKDFNSDEAGNQKSQEEVYNSPSWMEQFYIEMHNISPLHPAVWFYVDFKLSPGLSSVDMWKAVLRWVTIRNPELRTVYQPSNDSIRFGMKKIVFDPEDAKVDFNVVDISVLRKEWTEEDIERYCSFDITNDPPMRVLYSITGKEHYIRFIVSHVTSDLSSFFTLIGEFRDNCMLFLLTKNINIETKETFDIASMMEKELEAERYFLKDYWTDQLNRVNDVPTLASREKVTPVSGKNKKVVSCLPKELVAKLNSNSRRITVPQLLFSLYQILLHRVTGISAVPVVLCVDMRQHFPDLIKRVSLGINYVPVVTEFTNKQSSLHDFVSLCSQEMVKATGNSLYPFLLIKQLLNYRSDAYRHFFNVRDILIPFATSSKHPDYWMYNTGYNTEFLTEVETALNVIPNHENGEISLVLTYDPDLLDGKTAENFLDDLCTLACVSVVNNGLRADEIPLKCCTVYSPDGLDKYLSRVTFRKETSKGWDHPVKLMLDVQCDLPVVSWKSEKQQNRSTIRTVPVTSIIGIDIQKMEGAWCLIIQTTKRYYCFKANDFCAVRTWRDRIWKLI